MTVASKAAARKPELLGFGFQPALSEHFFLLSLPRSKAEGAEVTLSEHFEWREPTADAPIPVPINDVNAYLRVILRRNVWEEVAEDVKAEFNRRLRVYGLKTAQWPKSGQVPVDRTLGKELCVLLWAIEDCDPALINTAVRNWLGLVPEERWWLYTMTKRCHRPRPEGPWPRLAQGLALCVDREPSFRRIDPAAVGGVRADAHPGQGMTAATP
jgi:hypothetical protein